MPQIDLVETLVRCGSGGDRKDSCETLIPLSDPDPDPDEDQDLPPDSIRIPIQDSDIHYNNLNLERDDSAKESTNPKSQSHPNPNNPNPNSIHFRSNSQRTNLNANGPILGLPNKIKNVTCTVSRHQRQLATNSRIFPKKKSAAAGFEPSSPKVSCFGRVLSDRERGTCRRLQSRDSGCWKGFSLLFSCGGNEKAVVEDLEGSDNDVARRNIPSEAAAVPGLGGMKRFTSGRRAASWGGDVEVEMEDHVAVDLRRRSLDGNGVGPVAV